MAHFGEELRTERQIRGIDLEEIVAKTKVSIRYLTSLEEEHFDLLPGGVLNKGIVRNYARAIGLDEDLWTQRFMDAYRESGQMKDDDIHWIEFAENVSRNRAHKPQNSFFRLRWAGVLMLLAALAVSTWAVWNYVNSKVNAASQLPQTQTSQSQAQASQTSRPVMSQLAQSTHSGS